MVRESTVNIMNTKMRTEIHAEAEEEKQDPDSTTTATELKEKRDTETETDCAGELKSTESEPPINKEKEEKEKKKEPESLSENEESIVKEDCEESIKEAEEADSEDDEDQSNESTKSLDGDENPEAEALALSASLSSSRCLLKRNREDLDTDSDNDDNEEEPDSKKSHKAKEEEEVEKDDGESKDDGAESLKDKSAQAPVVVSKSKLSSAELLASMSSSKSVLKRGFEQVEEASCKEPEVKVKKSLITETSPITKDKSERKVIVEEVDKKIDDVKSPKAKDRQVFNVKSPVIPLSPLKSDLPIMESTRLDSPESSQPCIGEDSQRATPNKSLQSPKESVRKIAAKDLEEDRKLERKRLNKMLLIFSDQKPV